MHPLHAGLTHLSRGPVKPAQRVLTTGSRGSTHASPKRAYMCHVQEVTWPFGSKRGPCIQRFQKNETICKAHSNQRKHSAPSIPKAPFVLHTRAAMAPNGKQAPMSLFYDNIKCTLTATFYHKSAPCFRLLTLMSSGHDKWHLRDRKAQCDYADNCDSQCEPSKCSYAFECSTCIVCNAFSVRRGLSLLVLICVDGRKARQPETKLGAIACTFISTMLGASFVLRLPQPDQWRHDLIGA
jgi:hypothetical protein